MAQTPNDRSFNGIKPQLGERVFIHDRAFVNGEVTLGDDVSVWPHASIRGDMHWIKIGARTNVQDNAVLHTTHASNFNPDGFPLSIGDDVIIGHSAVLHGCTIGSRILIGMGAIVLDGATIQDEVMVAAGAMVPPGKVLESGYVYAGNPAKPLRELKPKEREFLGYSPMNYVKLKDQYIAERSERSADNDAARD